MDERQIISYKEKMINEIKGFREKGEAFLRKEISVAEFKGISGGMGVYAQKGGESFMLRLRIPSGILSRENGRLILDFAEKYGIQKLHLTTRQAIQLHNLTLEEVCEIMEEAIRKGLYTRGGGGNFPRNVAISPLSGVEPGEAFDVTPFALGTGEYLMEHMTEYHLPRKLKVAYSNGGIDNAGCTCTDMGFLAVVKEDKPYFKGYLAGGIGNNPAFGIELTELIEPSEALYYVKAVIKIFMAEGDYENKGKARLRYVPVRMGEEAFLKAFYTILAEVKAEGNLEFPADVIRELDVSITSASEGINHPETSDIDKLSAASCYKQKQAGLYAVNIHPICGQLAADDLKKLLNYLETEAKNTETAENNADNLQPNPPQVRLSRDESIYVTNLTGGQAEEILAILAPMNGTGSLEKSISCIGTPSCQVGMIASQELIHSILDYFKERKASLNRIPELSVSGCLNSCSRHQISSIGFTGIKKRVENEAVDAFELFTGGSDLEGACTMGKARGSIRKSDIPEFLFTLSGRLEELKLDFSEYSKKKEIEFEELIQRYKI